MDEQTKKRSKGRSPSYPGINLESAIERAKALWEKEGKNFLPIGAAFDHWGYKPKSSGGLTTLAALRKFGLLEEEGSGENRRIKLSELALKILWDERENSPERDEALKQAALNPSIHKDLWDKYKSRLPSDATLRIELRNKSFTERAINEFIQEFRETLSFTKLDKYDIIPEHEEDKIPPKGEDKMLMSRDSGRGIDSSKLVIEIPIPISATELGTIKMPYPLTKAQWDQMISILDAYKPTFVQSDTQAKDETQKS